MHCDRAGERVWIEVDLAADPITGLVHSGDDRARPFDGWLELVALLEAAREPTSDDGTSEPASDAP